MKRSFPVKNLRVNRVAKSYAASVAATETYVSTRKPTRMVTDPFLHPSMELHVGSLIGGKKLFGCADDEMMLRSLHLFPPAGNESFNLQAWISGELQELAPSVEIVANIRNWHPTLENWARLEPELRLAIQASRNSRGLAAENRAVRMNAEDGEVVGASREERISGQRMQEEEKGGEHRKAFCGKTYSGSDSSHLESCAPCDRETRLSVFRAFIEHSNGPNRAQALENLTKVFISTCNSLEPTRASLESERMLHDKTLAILRETQAILESERTRHDETRATLEIERTRHHKFVATVDHQFMTLQEIACALASASAPAPAPTRRTAGI